MRNKRNRLLGGLAMSMALTQWVVGCAAPPFNSWTHGGPGSTRVAGGVRGDTPEVDADGAMAPTSFKTRGAAEAADTGGLPAGGIGATGGSGGGTGGGSTGTGITSAAAPLPAPGTFTLVPAGAKVAQFRPTTGRLRIDIPGDVSTTNSPLAPTLDSVGPLALSTPQGITLIGHCDVLLSGTSKSILQEGTQTSGALIALPGEPAIVAANTTPFNFMAILWPRLAPGVLPPGPPIVRIELDHWLSSVRSGVALDVVYDIESIDAAGNALTTWKGTIGGLVVPPSPDGNQAAPPPPPPLPTGPFPLPDAGTFTLVPAAPKVAQFRPAQKRLRIDIPGDVAPGGSPTSTLDTLGKVAAIPPSSVTLLAHANVFFSGTQQSIMPAAPITADNFIISPGIAGQVQGADPNGQIVVFWPRLNTALKPGPAIFRVQLSDWDPNVRPGTALDVTYDVETVDPNGNILSQWNGSATNLIVP